ncbi:MAG: alkaline phosphatase family protein [Ignavibacteria bacterium]
MENHGYNQIIGSSQAPFINLLATDPKGALFTNSHGLTHPSQPNYLMLYSGSNQGVTNDNRPGTLPFITMNLGALLIDSGKTFIGYSEDLPYVGFDGNSSGYYVRKHNPWTNWQNSPGYGYPSTVNQPFTSFPSNYDSLPQVSFVIPNMIHDMHDGTIQQGDTWLHDYLNGYIIWSKTHNSLFILTWDEDNFTVPNQIPTIFVGEEVLAGNYPEHIDHYNILRTIEDMYNIPKAGASATATPIIDCWSVPTSVSNNSIPEKFYLEQNYPNPFNPNTVIRYSLIKNSLVKLKVYDLLGNEISTLVDLRQPAGSYDVEFNASKLASGIYYYRLQAEENTKTMKMTLLK